MIIEDKQIIFDYIPLNEISHSDIPEISEVWFVNHNADKNVIKYICIDKNTDMPPLVDFDSLVYNVLIGFASKNKARKDKINEDMEYNRLKQKFGSD